MNAIPSRIVWGLIFLISAGELRADPLSQWSWRFPNPQGITLRAVTYGGGQFVAVGDNGTIITSPDGSNWVSQTYNVFTNLRGVAYANGEYAAVGDGGVILVSSNATAWTQMPTVTASVLRGIAADPGSPGDGLPQFLAVGDSGTVIACHNGTNWTAATSRTSNSLYSVVFHPDFFLAVGNQGTVVFGSSGAFSQIPETIVGSTNNLYGVAISTGGQIAVVGDLNQAGENGILYTLAYPVPWHSEMWPGFNSPPNIIWQPSGSFILHGAAWGTNGFVAVGDTGYTLEYDYPGVVFTATNITNWTESSPYTSENSLYGATYGKGLYVLVGDAGAIVVTPDLLTWTEITGHHRSAILAIATSSNLCVASAVPIDREYSSFPDFTTLVSSNGINWSVSSASLPPMTDLTAGGAQFVGVSGTAVYTTTDGSNWQSNNSLSNSLHGVGFDNGEFIVVGDNGGIYTSVDATNWTARSVATTGSFYGVAHGNGLYVTAGTAAATSPDGLTWLLCPSNPPAGINRIVFGKGVFVAAGTVGMYNGEILTSTDGTNWAVHYAGDPITGLAYNAGTFLAGSADGELLQSLDGTNWAAAGQSLPVVDNDTFEIYYETFDLVPILELEGYSSVCAYQGTFFAGGLDGILVQSGNIWNPATLGPSQSSSNGFNFTYNQQIDVPFHIQTSTDLTAWQNVYAGMGTGQPTNFSYVGSPNDPKRFFRIVSP